ncbi:unnamed protein product [Adineta steineri]|uniref:Uncharacterized protein n=3 Tax=Adineta steineri TaxID=433720 RepID=A0A818UR96_9BILA|nr:unnamed protein product [Adineta steineri]CAF3701699.1 unnamed protein product [Adineta steineri]
MKFLYLIILLINTLYINGFSEYADDYDDRTLTLHGQIINLHKHHISIEPGSHLIIELHDISVTDQLSTKIAQQTINAYVFPITFSVNYEPNEVVHNHLYVLYASIVNNRNEVTFTSERRNEVKLLGPGRTTYVDVPVIGVTSDNDVIPYVKLEEWPELLGRKGEEAVRLIKRQTGLEEVFVVTKDTHVSKDLRYDRVCVYVDDYGIVSQIPRNG